MALLAYIDNIETEVANLRELSWDFVGADGNPNAVLVEELELVIKKTNEATNGIAQYIQNFGYLKPIPVRLVDTNIGEIFNGFGDLASSIIACDDVRLKANTQVKTFETQANGLNLRKLWNNTALPASERLTVDIVGGDVNRVNYIINRPADAAEQQAILVITSALIVTEIIQLIKNFADGVASSAALQPWFLISTGVQFAALAISLAVALDDILELLIDRIRQYYCVKVLPLLQKACLHLGFSFDSSIFLDADWAQLNILGETGEAGVKSGQVPTNIPIPDMTLGDLLGEMEKIFYARVKVSNGIVRLEPREFYFQNPANFQIQNTQNTPDRATPNYQTNISELAGSYKFGFAVDSLEPNTIAGVTGNKVVATYNFVSGESNTLTAQVDNSTTFARGERRETQTAIETFFNAISDELNGFFGTPLAQLGDRIGMLELDADFVGTPKLFILNEARGRVRPVSTEKLNAKYLYENFHRKHIYPAGEWARWTIVRGLAEQPICSGDGGNVDVIIAQLRENNVCTDFEGRLSVVEAHVYSEETGMHEFQYRFKGWINPLLNNVPADLTPDDVTEQLTED